MKKVISLLIILIICLTFAACDDSDEYSTRFDIEVNEYKNLDELELYEKLTSEISDIVSEYTDDEGLFEADDKVLTKAMKEIYQFSRALDRYGIIDGSAKNDEGKTVSFFWDDHSTYIWSPTIKDTYSGGNNYTVLGIETLIPYEDIIISGISGGGLEKATGIIYENVYEYSKSFYSSSDAQIPELQRVLSSLGDMNARVVIIRGHGCVYTEKDGSTHWALTTYDKVSEEKTKSTNYKIGDINLPVDGNYYAINDLFFEKYMSEVDGGLFYAESCCSALADAAMAKIVHQKGFDVYCGANGLIGTKYSDNLLRTFVEYLSTKDENGIYLTFSEAFNKAKEEEGDHDLAGVKMLSFEYPSEEPFRIVPHTHDFFESFSYDKNEHWNECACGEKKNVTAHLYSDEWIVSDTEHWLLCECGYEGEKDKHSSLNSKCSGCGNSIGLAYSQDTVEGIGICIDTELVIPYAYNNITIKTIGISAFENLSNITSVTLPKGVLNINLYAFKGCSSLKSVSLPKNLQNINSEAFMRSALTEISVPAGVTLRNKSFAECFELSHVILEEGITEIPNECFIDCAKLSYVSLPSTILSIKYKAFQNCTSLNSIDLGDSLQALGGYCFKNCSSLSQIEIPGSVKNVESNAFCECKNLKSVLLHEGVEEIYEGAFFGCEALQTLVLPNSLVKIGDDAFRYCFSLITLDMPDSLKKIGSRCFADCVGLTNVNFSTSLESIPWYAFWGCTSLTVIDLPVGIKGTGFGTFTGCTSLTKVIVRDKDFVFGSYPFDNLQEILIVGVQGSELETQVTRYWGGQFEYIQDADVATLINQFISDSRFANGAQWGPKTPQQISKHKSQGCCAYAADFVKFVYDSDDIRSGTEYNSADEITSGDVIYVTNTDHWIVVLERRGNVLYTAEANWGSTVIISDQIYTIENGVLHRKGEPFRTFSSGYDYD